jgi:hypothetical protein
VPTSLASPVSTPLGQRPMLHGGDESRGSRVWTWVILGLGLAMIGLVALLILVLGRA